MVVSGKKTGSKAVYNCLSGYILFGHQVLETKEYASTPRGRADSNDFFQFMQELVCGIGGQWSQSPPACKYVDCGVPPVVENGQYALVNGSTTYASIVEYMCNEDYWLKPANRKRQICTKEGRWSADPPNCECENTWFSSEGLINLFRRDSLRFSPVPTVSGDLPRTGSSSRRCYYWLRLQRALDHRVRL